MRNLVALLRSIYVEAFNRKDRAHSRDLSTPRHQRFILESLERRVLLSVDVGSAYLIDQPESSPEEQVVVMWTDGEERSVDSEEEDGDFIDREAFDETDSPFDSDALMTLEPNGAIDVLSADSNDSSGTADALTNNNAGAAGASNFTQSETSVLAFGNIVLVAFNDSGSRVGGLNKGTGFALSTDGGATFTDGGTLPTNSGGDAGDPVLARNDTTGRIYFATLGATVSTIQLFRSDDNGASWMLPVNATPGGSSEDKPWLTVDNFAGPGNGNVYVVSRRFGGTAPGIYFFSSTDNGATFGPTGGTIITPSNQGAFVTVGPDHSVYVFWWAGSTIQMRKSVDQGLTFGAPVIVATGLVTSGDLGLTGIRQGTSTASGFRSNEFPHAAVNPVNGDIYVTYNNDGPGVDKADVFLVQSTTGGSTWNAPVKVNDDLTTTDQWQPTLAVTPDGDKLGVFYSSRQEDPIGNNLFKYYGRIASISGSTLMFTPSFAISDTPSLPEFGRDTVVNLTYMGDYNTAFASDNFFAVSWSDNRNDLPGGAGRKDPNVYFKAVDLGLAVRTTSPAIGSVVQAIPLNYVVNFSDPIDIASVSAGDFMVDGVIADGFTVSSPTQVTFHFLTAPFSTQGLHTMSMSAGAILRISDGDGLAAFSGNFRYDALLLQVVSTVPPPNGVFTLPGPFALDLNFNEAVDPASVQTWDLVLSGISGAFVSAVTVLPGNTTARFTLSGITAQGSISAAITAGSITDAFGNPGGAFISTTAYSVDINTVPYPAPLSPRNPLESLIYDPSVSGFISFAGDVDSFTLNVDPNQTISLILTPTSSSLQPRIEVFDPNNDTQGFAIGGPGQIAGIQTKPANVGGVYTFAVTGTSGTTGGYTLQVILNSAFELEGKVLGSTNDTLTSTVQTIGAMDMGSYAKLGTHSASDNNYTVGQLFGFGQVITEFRNYATFDLPAGTPAIFGAELRLFNPFSYSSPDLTETYTLFDVSATAAELDTTRAGGLDGISIFGDLGSGTIYGTRVVSAADNNTAVSLQLNAAAVAALNAAIGSTISFGGAITTLAGTAASQMIGGTSALGVAQLVLQTAPAITAQNIDSSFITVGTPQTSAQRGAVLGQTDLAGNYNVAAVPFTFEDISGTGIVIAPMTNQDNVTVSIPIGFTFPLYGISNTSVSVSSNGLLTFGLGGATPLNTDLTTIPGQAAIAPFWDDLHTGGGVLGSNVFFQTLGSGVNRHLTIQWNNVRFLSGGATGDTITFEVQLFADGRIQFNYLDLASGIAAGNDGGSATVGIKAAGTQGPNRLLLAFNNGPNAFVGTGKSTLISLGDPAPDYYAFTVNTGETITLAATSQSDDVTVELRDSSDAVLTTGIGDSSNLTSVISNFVTAFGGTYYARVISSNGAISMPYSLVVTRNAALDMGDNHSAATAQGLPNGTLGVLGYFADVDAINAVDSGWIRSDGVHTATNGNYAVGNLPPSTLTFRNYGTFALSATTPTIIGAELRLFNPAGGYNSPDPTETFTLYDVSATLTDLDANRVPGDAAGITIFDDLGSGMVFGTRDVSAADNNTTVAITLNAAAVAALNAAIGSMISFGGAMTTLAGTAFQNMFGGSTGAPGTVQLILDTVPADWYSITVPDTGDSLRLETSTPGDGPGEFVNTFNPRIELYDTTGTTLIASGVAMADGRNEYIQVSGLTPGATYKVRVIGEAGTAGEYFLSKNFSPVVTNVTVASPINENDAATVSGTFSDAESLDTHTVVIAWGAGEGSTTLTLAAGVSTFSATHQYFDDNPSGTLSDVYSISVTVSDNHSASGLGSVDLTVNNVAPVVAPVSGPSSGVRGQSLDFSGSFTDVGSLDTHEVRWDFGDGTIIDFHSTADPNALTAPTHVYTTEGVYTVTLSIRDDDGGLTTVNKTVTIAAVAIQADPCDPGQTALVVGGTTGNDTIVFDRQGTSGDILVYINNVLQGVFQPTGHIIAFGLDGDDAIQVANSIDLEVVLYGDADNDHLKSGSGASTLVGGDGDDVLHGGTGRSILIGGHGEDRLIGGSGEDLLIGGTTSYDGNTLGLCALLNGWNASMDYAVRVSNLRSLLNSSSVFDDDETDMLIGGSGLDWFSGGAGDVIAITQEGEIIG